MQLKQDVFEFTRKLRLKEFFAEKVRNNDDEYDGNYKNSINNSNTFHKKSQSTFIPPAGRDSTLDFYIEAITHEILQQNKNYKYRSNLSHEEQTALTSLCTDESIVVKKAGKSSTVVIMNLLFTSNFTTNINTHSTNRERKHYSTRKLCHDFSHFTLPRNI